MPGRARLFGFAAASGLPHQLDVVAAVHGAIVVIELKAHAGCVPKNDLLRFVAATDDFVLGLGRDLPDTPVYRLLATLGRTSRGMRRYASIHGVGIVESGRWPAVVLAAPDLVWPEDGTAPGDADRSELARLVRPVQQVVRMGRHGVMFTPGPAGLVADRLLDLEDEWSGRLWAALRPGLPQGVSATEAAA